MFSPGLLPVPFRPSNAMTKFSDRFIYHTHLQALKGATMGSVRQTYIKRVAFELIEKHPEEFTREYQHNKEGVSRLTDVNSKMMRNRIAGYVTRCKAQGL